MPVLFGLTLLFFIPRLFHSKAFSFVSVLCCLLLSVGNSLVLRMVIKMHLDFCLLSLEQALPVTCKCVLWNDAVISSPDRFPSGA